VLSIKNLCLATGDDVYEVGESKERKEKAAETWSSVRLSLEHETGA